MTRFSLRNSQAKKKTAGSIIHEEIVSHPMNAGVHMFGRCVCVRVLYTRQSDDDGDDLLLLPGICPQNFEPTIFYIIIIFVFFTNLVTMYLCLPRGISWSFFF